MATMHRISISERAGHDGLVSLRGSETNGGGAPMMTPDNIPMTTAMSGTTTSTPSNIKMPPKPATVEHDDDPVTEPPASIIVGGDGGISGKTTNGNGNGGGYVDLSKKPTIKRNISSSAADSGCSYRDYSRVPANETSNVASIFKAASAKEPTFPVKLHMILSNSDFEDIVSWMPHGRSWRILKPELFEDRVLPQFFCHCRLSSFMRQVNGWGFRRIKHGPDYNSYYNELFLRGLPHLAERMRRESVSARSKQSSSSSPSKRASSEDEPTPDLYKISEDNPVPENPPKPGKANENHQGPDPVVSASSSMGLPKPSPAVAPGGGAVGLPGLYGQAPLGASAGQFGALGGMGMGPGGPGLTGTNAGLMGSTGLTPSEEAAFLAGAAASRNAAGAVAPPGAAMSQQQMDMVNAFRASRMREEQRRLDEMNRLAGGMGGRGANLFNEQQQQALLREQQVASMLRAGATGGDDKAELRRMVRAEQENLLRQQQQQAVAAQAGMGMGMMNPQASAAVSRFGAAPGMDYGSLAAFPPVGNGMNMNVNMNAAGLQVGFQDYERLARAAQAQQQQPAMQQQQHKQPDHQVSASGAASTASGEFDISSLPILHRPRQV